MKIRLLFLLFLSTVAFAQKEPFLRNKSLIAIPVVFRFPETGWGGGLGATSSWNFNKDSLSAKLSTATASLTYTQNGQILAFLPLSIFTKNNKYFFNADQGWFRYNYFYYGIGENRVSQESYDTDFLRLRWLAAQQVNPTTYLGIRLNFESFDVTKVFQEGELSSGEILGSDFSRTSAIGLAILKDTRDQVFYPSKGIFAEFNLLPSSRIFGANVEFTQATLDFSHYQSLHERVVLASNLFSVSTFGERVPFSQLAQFGGGRKMRGLYFGYFRDKNVALIQEEIRYNIWRFLGVVGFGAIGWMGDEDNYLRLSLPKFTYGAGLRIATKNKLNLRLDYGFSPYEKGNFYATIGEAF